ncbi:unnamed protein product, partial [Urochloa humidicola]
PHAPSPCFLSFPRPIQARFCPPPPPQPTSPSSSPPPHMPPLACSSASRTARREAGTQAWRARGKCGGHHDAPTDPITARLRIRRGTAMAGTSGPQIECSAWRRVALFLRRKRRTRRRVSLDCHSILVRSASTFFGQQAKLERALAVDYSAPASSNPSPAGPMVVAAALDRLTRSAHVLLCIPSM